MKKTPRRLFSLLIPATLALFAACEGTTERIEPPQPISERMSWDGHFAQSYGVDSGQALTSQDHQGGILRIHTFELPSAEPLQLVLTEFRSDFSAYRRFQEKALPEEIRDGFFRKKNSLFFFHGPFLGELRYERSGLIPASFLKERLSFQDEELFRRPAVFKSFPLVGQIPFSERVVSSDFLGQVGSDTVFIMRYQCHRDTATIFRAFVPIPVPPERWPRAWKGQTDTLPWTLEYRFSGVQALEQPLLFWTFKGGFVGVAGCYDLKLAQEYAEKLKKMALLVNKP